MEDKTLEQEETLVENKEMETPEKTEEETEAPEEPSEPEKAEESKTFQTLDAQKRYWRERAQKAEGKLKSSKSPVSTSPEDTDFWKAKVDFLIQNTDKKYSEEEFDLIATSAMKDGISLSESAKKLDGYIQFEREKVAEKQKIPAPGSSSPFASIEKTPEEIAKMPREEHMKYEAQIMKERQGRGV